MANERYTIEGLPVVSKRTIDSYGEEQFRWLRNTSYRNFEIFIKNIEDRLKDENLELYRFYKKIPRYDKSMETGCAIGFCILYDLLRRQAEANKLEENFE